MGELWYFFIRERYTMSNRHTTLHHPKPPLHGLRIVRGQDDIRVLSKFGVSRRRLDCILEEFEITSLLCEPDSGGRTLVIIFEEETLGVFPYTHSYSHTPPVPLSPLRFAPFRTARYKHPTWYLDFTFFFSFFYRKKRHKYIRHTLIHPKPPLHGLRNVRV